jgi:hypothetical protein
MKKMNRFEAPKAGNEHTKLMALFNISMKMT